jgi:SsrA-binding protein
MKKEKKVIARNRKARHEYEILDTVEVGLVLEGSEIKSIREGKISLSGSYASLDDNGELWVHQMHIAEYPQARDNHEPYRDRKLLAHRRQLRKMGRLVREKGYTLIPLDIHLNGGRAKLELGMCRGKKQYDKRRDIAERDNERKIRTEMKRAIRGNE